MSEPRLEDGDDTTMHGGAAELDEAAMVHRHNDMYDELRRAIIDAGEDMSIHMSIHMLIHMSKHVSIHMFVQRYHRCVSKQHKTDANHGGTYTHRLGLVPMV